MVTNEYDGLHLIVKGPRADLTMDRPDAGNSLTMAHTANLLAAVQRIAESDVRVLILRGGERAWCVGGDVREFDTARDRRSHMEDLVHTLHCLVDALTSMDAIVVAAVDGVAAGAGTPLAAAADIVLASERARFTLGYTKIGLTPDGGTTLLTSTLGLHRTLRLALLNPMLSATEAWEAGLVAEVVPPEKLDSAVEQVVEVLLTGPPTALARTKRLVRARAVGDAPTALRAERVALVDAAAGDEATEGISAFLDKRLPAFGGSGQPGRGAD